MGGSIALHQTFYSNSFGRGVEKYAIHKENECIPNAKVKLEVSSMNVNCDGLSISDNFD